jgi:hypothetical protein
MLDEITKLEQLKASSRKAAARTIEPRGDSPVQKANFKHRLDLKKDTVKHSNKRVDYYEKELEIRDKQRQDLKKEKERGPGILRRLTGRT